MKTSDPAHKHRPGPSSAKGQAAEAPANRQAWQSRLRRAVDLPSLAVLLSIALALLVLRYHDWPPNRDITTYATIAQQLINGERLYIDTWDLKPPAIFVVYMIAQELISSKALQILALEVIPSIIVLVALLKAGREAGFGSTAGIWSALVWLALSGNLRLQMHEPNTEIFINACVILAFSRFLRLRRDSPVLAPIVIGALFALACLFKTVAIAMAAGMALVHVALPPHGSSRATAAGQVAVMAASGLLCLAVVFGYFAITGRSMVFWEVMVDAGASYAGNVWLNIIAGLTLAPLVGERLPLQAAAAVGPWLLVALLTLIDRERRRSWALLGAYAFSALIAVSLPGSFYAHYFQLLVPPFCLGFGWLAVLAARQSRPSLATAARVAFGLALAVLVVHEIRSYLVPAERHLAGTYGELYLETQKLGRRLGGALDHDEVLYQWGEESGLYWFSGKSPPASVLRWPLFRGPQAERLTQQTLESLAGRPPDVIVAVNRVLDSSVGHPVFEWILANYGRLEPLAPEERKFFTFFVHSDAPEDLRQRVLDASDAAPLLD